MPPLTTPFDGAGEVDFAALDRNVARYNTAGLAGYIALGSNGEAVHLTPGERARVIETVKRAAARGLTLIAGVNELSTRAAIEACRSAAGSGAEAALVITPYYYKSSMTQDALARHFIKVADASPIPVLVYNVPQNTAITIESKTIARLAEHQNIIGLKDSAGNMGAISETIRLVPAGFSVLTGNGGILYPSLAMGAVGAILAVVCVAPRACVDLFEAVRAGDHERAIELQNRIGPVSNMVTARLGVPGLKAAMEMAGYTGGAPRAPLAKVNDNDMEELRSVLRASGLFPQME